MDTHEESKWKKEGRRRFGIHLEQRKPSAEIGEISKEGRMRKGEPWFIFSLDE